MVKAVEQSLEVKAAKGLLRKRLPKPGSDGPVVAPPLVKVPKKKNVEAEEKQLKLAKQKKMYEDAVNEDADNEEVKAEKKEKQKKKIIKYIEESSDSEEEEIIYKKKKKNRSELRG